MKWKIDIQCENPRVERVLDKREIKKPIIMTGFTNCILK